VLCLCGISGLACLTLWSERGRFSLTSARKTVATPGNERRQACPATPLSP
jgi:hypothetical protein